MAQNSGFDGLGRPQSTDWEEHAAQADLSTGIRFKRVQDVPNKVLIDEVDANTTYIGDTKPGIATSEPYWRIKKITISGTVTEISFADGTDTFTKEWDDRTTYTYS